MPYWRLFYHLVWATRDRAPLIDPPAADLIERSLRATCHHLGTLPHAVGWMPDHVHLVASIPPNVALGTAVGRLKGAAAHLLNHADLAPDRPAFAWQSEYGLLSFGERALPDVVAYVLDQPNRHAADRTWLTLERTTAPTPSRLQPAS